MAEEWAKLHTSILGDPKLMRAARKGAKGLEMLPWLIAFAKADGRDGYLVVGQEPAEAEDIAELIPGKPARAVAACMQSCEEIGTLSRDDAYLYFTNWERRNVVRPSDTPSAITERVRRHRERKRAERNGETLGETSETPFQGEGETGSNALDIDGDVEEDRDREIEKDQTPLSAGADVVVHSGPVLTPGTDLVSASQVKVRLTADAIIQGLGEVMAAVAMGTRDRLTAEQKRGEMAKLVFAYWGNRLSHPDALYDDKRRNRILARLRENGDDIHELLYAIDGSLKDDRLMGRLNDSDRKYDGIETILRDRAQVERLSNLAPKWRAKEPHPIAVRYARTFDDMAQQLAGAQEGAA